MSEIYITKTTVYFVMGCEDAVINSKEKQCKLCDIEYVCWQEIVSDDSHYIFEQEYSCPICTYSKKQQEDFARRRNNCFMVAEIPRKNLNHILDYLMKKYEKIPSPVGWKEEDWRGHLPERFKGFKQRLRY